MPWSLHRLYETVKERVVAAVLSDRPRFTATRRCDDESKIEKEVLTTGYDY